MNYKKVKEWGKTQQKNDQEKSRKERAKKKTGTGKDQERVSDRDRQTELCQIQYSHRSDLCWIYSLIHRGTWSVRVIPRSTSAVTHGFSQSPDADPPQNRPFKTQHQPLVSLASHLTGMRKTRFLFHVGLELEIRPMLRGQQFLRAEYRRSASMEKVAATCTAHDKWEQSRENGK